MIPRRSFGLLRASGTPTAAVVFGLTLTAGLHAIAQSPSPSASGRLMLAVVRNDGILLPFAAFNGRKWSAPWPTLDRVGPTVDLPVSLASVPRDWWGGEEPGPWQLWTPDADTPRPLTLSSVAMVPVGRTRQIGFRTNQAPVLPAVPPFELPFPKMGLAIAGDVRLTPIVTVSPFSPAHKAFASKLRQAFEKAEEAKIGAIRSADRWTHPFKREIRATVPVELEAWYVTSIGSGEERMSYVEAVKKYPLQAEDRGCGLETFVSGWVHHDERRQKLTPRLNAVVSYCDRRGVSYMLPFGQILVNDRVHWIVQLSGQDHEWYAVVEGTSGRARYVAEYQAGWSLNR
jgi:hypothetical protein